MGWKRMALFLCGVRIWGRYYFRSVVLFLLSDMPPEWFDAMDRVGMECSAREHSIFDLKPRFIRI